MKSVRTRKLVGVLTIISLSGILCLSPVAARDPGFQEFSVDVYTGPVRAPDLASHPDARTYRTRLKNGAKGSANFAGKYILTTWGCGANCLHGALQDAESGRVFFLPHAICCGFEMGDDVESIEFRRDSSLIVFSGLRDEKDPMGTHYYEFAENEFWLLKTVKFSPGSTNPVAGQQPPGDTGNPDNQSSNVETVRNVPGRMQLLPGYRHVPLQGIDSVIGRIEKDAGLEINYEIGPVQAPGEARLGGSFIDRPKQSPNHETRWYREQTVNGQKVHIAYRKDDVLQVSYPKSGTNFAARIGNAGEMAEALLMILTFRADEAK